MLKLLTHLGSKLHVGEGERRVVMREALEVRVNANNCCTEMERVVQLPVHRDWKLSSHWKPAPRCGFKFLNCWQDCRTARQIMVPQLVKCEGLDVEIRISVCQWRI